MQQFFVGDNPLTGSIPSLSGLTSLQWFYAGANQLTGSIPALSGLTALQQFEVDSNQLTGPIPSLSGLTALELFYIHDNQLTGSVPAAPTSLWAGLSKLCGNRLVSSGNKTIDAAWVIATKTNWLACQIVVANPPVCALIASAPTSTGGSYTLTAYCTPAATSYWWSSNTGFIRTMSSGRVLPSVTTTYSVVGANAVGLGNTALVTVSVTPTAITTANLKLTSPAFLEGGVIPNQFTYSLNGQCNGNNWSPPLRIANPPAGTQSFAIVVHDPDGGNWLHWKAWNIEASTALLPTNAAATARFSQGRNDFGTSGYGGPCPPSGNHRYTFTLYALSTTFSTEPSETQLTAASLGTATLTGYRAPTSSVTAKSYQQALFVNASTSTNKTSVVRVINTGNTAGTLTATAYNEAGTQLGTANATLGTLAANQTLIFTSAQLEQALGFTPSGPTSKYSVYFSASLPGFQIINYTKDNATGSLTLSQSQNQDRSANASETSSTRVAWFMSASTSANKTNVLRLFNTSSLSGALYGYARDESGSVLGTSATTNTYTSLGSLGAYQMLTYTSADIESALGFTPSAPTGKYGVTFYARVPNLELINFTKDIATGNLTLVQAQLEDRPSTSDASSTRQALVVYPSTLSAFNTVMRVVSPNSTTATLTGTAYNEAGSIVGSGTLGTVEARQILILTSAQIESALHYFPSSTSSKYRLVITANVPSFEVINDIKVPSTGNLYLAQAQTDSRTTGNATPMTRGVYVIYPASGSPTSQVLVINPTSVSATLSATAYNEAGSVVATNTAFATLGANQTLTFTSAQLQSLMGYTPAAGLTWRIVLGANLSNFEVINYAVDYLTGLPVLAQPWIE